MKRSPVEPEGVDGIERFERPPPQATVDRTSEQIPGALGLQVDYLAAVGDERQRLATDDPRISRYGADIARACDFHVVQSRSGPGLPESHHFCRPHDGLGDGNPSRGLLIEPKVRKGN